MDDARPRRSALYVPAANERALVKARGFDADVLLFDLEDAVAPGDKAAARATLVRVLAAGGFAGQERVVRVNGLATPWGQADLAAAAALDVEAVLLPKVESAGEVAAALTVLERHGARSELALWCMIETPRGVLAAATIAAASPRLGALVAGTSDLSKYLHARHSRAREPLLMALSTCVLAARAAGLAALDGVHLDLDDEDGLVAACEQGRSLGFDGKTLIHPKQLAAANRAFAPSEAELASARRVVEAYAAAGKGVTIVDGRLVEALHVREAERLLALAARITARVPRP